MKVYRGGTLIASGTTNTSGIYLINQELATGSYDIEFSKSGYTTKTVRGVSLTAGVLWAFQV